jgi:hypothetical protein
MIYEQATQIHQLHQHHHPHHAHYLPYDPPPLEFEDTPTLSPPEGYKDRFFPQMLLIEQQQQQQQNQQQLDPGEFIIPHSIKIPKRRRKNKEKKCPMRIQIKTSLKFKFHIIPLSLLLVKNSLLFDVITQLSPG